MNETSDIHASRRDPESGDPEPVDRGPGSGHPRRRRFLRRLGLLAGGMWLAPVWRAQGTADQSPEFHVVRAGDTLSEIAEAHGIPLTELRMLNGIKSSFIRPGQRLRLRAAPDYPLLAPIRSLIAVKNLERARWKHIILHHSATPSGNASIFDRYHRNRRHMENGLAYHFIIGNGSDSADGEIEVGGRWTRQLNGGHVRSLALNDNSIGICLVGNFEQTRPTRKQVAASMELVAFLKRALLGGKPDLLLHREIHGEHTLCPGQHFPERNFRKLRA